MTIFYCLTFEVLPTWRARFPYLYSQEEGGPVIPPGTGFPFRRLLRLQGLRWRYSNPPPNGEALTGSNCLVYCNTTRCCVCISFCGDMLASRCLTTMRGSYTYRQQTLLRYDPGRIEDTASNIILLLRVYSLPLERVYGAVA
jgi:hypothetical protein